MKHYLVYEFPDSVNKNKFTELGTQKGATVKDNILRELETWAGELPTSCKITEGTAAGNVVATLPVRIGAIA